MSFRTKKLRKRPPRKPLRFLSEAFKANNQDFKEVDEKSKAKKGGKKWHYAWGSVLVLFGMFVVGKVTFAVYDFVANFNFIQDVGKIIGQELEQTDGKTNIILLGGSGHDRKEGASLIDAFLTASIDWDKGTISMISIPRDYYVESENIDVNGRINALYVLNNHLEEDERLELYQTAVGETLGVDIHYYMRIDFDGFVEVVDALGGVTVDVPQPIYDYAYPNETDTGTIVFQLEEGIQEMDGETALKYARTRHDGYGDFGRAARQQQIMAALQEKALSRGVLTNPGKIKDIYDAITDNMDTNISILELVELAAFAHGFDRNNLVTTVLHDDPGRDGGGGFLMAGSMEVYGGYTLLPRDYDLKPLHQYANLLFDYPKLFSNPPSIEVLNATKESNIAFNTAYQLSRFGFNVTKIGNYEDSSGERQNLEESFFIYYPAHEEVQNSSINPQIELLLEVLPDFVKGTPMAKPGVISGEVPILTIVLGQDHELYVD